MIEPFLTDKPVLGKGAWVHPQATVIGRCRLGEDVSIWPHAVLRGDVNSIEIGARSNIQDGAVVHVTHQSETTQGAAVVVGQDVTVGHRAVLHGCTIEDRCLIGMGAIILDGACIEADTLIGAGALVPPGKHLEGGMLYVGSPARPVRALTKEEQQFLRYSAEHYVRLKDQYVSG
ncbi:MAG TPA: gamma carbonic anhydrase family protein [Sulfurivirga caldicuralii]|nr:gamma carbonic anhydrase family protein [Sulfurivirga caldicuralii]